MCNLITLTFFLLPQLWVSCGLVAGTPDRIATGQEQLLSVQGRVGLPESSCNPVGGSGSPTGIRPLYRRIVARTFYISNSREPVEDVEDITGHYAVLARELVNFAAARSQSGGLGRPTGECIPLHRSQISNPRYISFRSLVLACRKAL
ncbi:uncharacterized protein BO95DRAFT_427102 [Aspergillus brunneoviolaceus CBS 621.78]|uniref:Uncharacterized protein n=1 Tax=Aspergillus brunneoviolaceus CBS 621.78 TaxID=1450534 RepID=A0ACD1GPW0_9EURO|nr:hypothetical protein BO95DRAFT_427102 [Aspergillus brunneoviolaceus CBS 621.78]RAH51291.1 hypothetical protein BO95DRAFT_427102 [Aspergillus brunneoviolaceus CBS 621.78]